MRYPFNLMHSNNNPFPLFGNFIQGAPHIFNFSSTNPAAGALSTENFENFQKEIFDELAKSGASWGIGRYLEERKTLLRQYSQIINEGRYYHLGIDIIVPGGITLYSPLDAGIHAVGCEEGVGNYGGYVVLKHNSEGDTFYSFYGHLDTSHLPRKNATLKKGAAFAQIGNTSRDTGGWFTHTHLQILTERAIQEKRMLQGYISKDDLPLIEYLFPNPYFILKY